MVDKKIFDKPKDFPTDEMYKESEICSIRQLRIKISVWFVWITVSIVPSCINIKLVSIILTTFFHQVGAKCIVQTLTKIYNEISTDVKALKRINSMFHFKKSYKTLTRSARILR